MNIQPIKEQITILGTDKNLIQDFQRQLHLPRRSLVLNPRPELRNLIERIIRSRRRDQHIRIEKVQHGLAGPSHGKERLDIPWFHSENLASLGIRDRAVIQ